MPYCAKCGVEVNEQEKKCPLCHFQIPDIGDTPSETERVFPKGQNMYKERVRTLKNKVFYVVVSLAILALPVLFTIQFYYPQVALSMSYAMISVIVSPFYLYFLLGYLSPYANIIGIGVTSLLFTFVLDHMRMPATWFYQYALYIIIWLVMVICLFYYLYGKSRFRNQLFYVPTYIIGSIGLLSVGIDGLLVYRTRHVLHLTWSIVVLISSLSLCVMLLILYHILPRHVKDSIKRRLHL